MFKSIENILIKA